MMQCYLPTGRVFVDGAFRCHVTVLTPGVGQVFIGLMIRRQFGILTHSMALL